MLLKQFKNCLNQPTFLGYVYKFHLLLIAVCVIAMLALWTNAEVLAADGELNISLPKRIYNIPAGALGKTLAIYSAQAGVVLVFDPTLTDGKTTAGLKGEYTLVEGYRKLLESSGLEVKNNDKGEYTLSKTPKPSLNQNLPDIEIDLKETQVRASRFKNIGPLPGLALTKEQIAGNIQSITAKEIKEAHSLSLSDLMNSKLQSVNVNDYQGNPFQMDVTYRGFTASPQLGTPQGLSVFFDGIRVNEPFGDVVNWDMIPMNALDGMEIYPGSNPLFGLNTLGGALAVRTKSGFTSQGMNAEILTGSYGRKQLQASAGGSKEGLAAFGAVNLFMEDGWRKNSPSEVNQAFGKLEWQGDRASLGLSGLGIVNKLVGNGTVPLELYSEDPTAVFTSPDITRNTLMQMQISGAFDVSDTFNISGMVYKRDSNRKSSTGDIIDVETFRGFGEATRRVAPGVTATCAYTDANGDGFPDYYLDALDPNTGSSPFLDDYNAHGSIPNYSLLGPLNPVIPSAELERLKGFFPKNYVTTNQAEAFLNDNGGGFNQDFTFVDNGITYRVVAKPAVNAADCNNLQRGQLAKDNGRVILPALDANGQRAVVRRDGAQNGIDGIGTGAGVISGTPTGILTNSNIQQSTQGGSVQLNWNLEQHKFMVGVSIDASKASYLGKQRFGVLDNNRNVTSNPSLLGEEFYAADHDVTINDFSGKLSTRSLYFSETWSPTETLNFGFSSRYNYTDVQNQLAPKKAEGFGSAIERLYNQFDLLTVCPGTDLSNCPIDISKPVPLETLLARSNSNLKSLDRKAMESFAYHSLNPSLGVTWQATPRLNLYANWNQGTRVPSVIELGCAYDGTVVPFGLDEFGNQVELSILRERFPTAKAAGSKPRSLIEGRGCNLPSALSGDPYLPQVIARTVEFGARGKFKDLLEWNISAYQTKVGDDLYLVSATPQLSFFQSIGDTLRRGIEFGLSGEYGKSDFRLNYSLTDATFQSNFRMLSPNNSSTLSNNPGSPLYGQIQVNPGDRLPGVPLNNVNVSWGYKVTPALKISFNLVGHSNSFVRGNENNEHTPGPGKGVLTTKLDPITNQLVQQIIPTPDYRESGTSAGYAVLNFRGTYEIGGGWTAGVMVNNLLDKKYFSAGRLGLTPFAPSTYGAIGPGGFNYNSSEWLSTQFMSAGAPRGIWLTLGYDFDASKKYDPPPSRISMTEPDRTIPPEQLPSSTLPTEQELAVQKALAQTSSLPVIKSLAVGSNVATAQQEVKDAIERWRKAWSSNDVMIYLQSYAANFAPENMSRESWEQQRKLQVVSAASPQVTIENLIIAPQGKRIMAVFVQNYQSQQYQDTVKKMLYLERQEGRWLIIREHATPVTKASILPNSNLEESGAMQNNAKQSQSNSSAIRSIEMANKTTLRKNMGIPKRVQITLNQERL